MMCEEHVNLVGQAVLWVRCTECLHVMRLRIDGTNYTHTTLCDDALVQFSWNQHHSWHTYCIWQWHINTSVWLCLCGMNVLPPTAEEWWSSDWLMMCEEHVNLVWQAVLWVRCTECLHIMHMRRDGTNYMHTTLCDDALLQLSWSCNYTALMCLDTVLSKCAVGLVCSGDTAEEVGPCQHRWSEVKHNWSCPHGHFLPQTW